MISYRNYFIASNRFVISPAPLHSYLLLLLSSRYLILIKIRPSLDRTLERPLSSSVTIEATRPGISLRRSIKGFVRMKCHAMVLDAALNSYPTVLRTVYRMFLFAAMRTHNYLKSMNKAAMKRNVLHLCRSVYEAVMFGARLIHSRTRRFSVRQLRLGANAATTSTSSSTSTKASSRTKGADGKLRNQSSSTKTQRSTLRKGTDNAAAAECNGSREAKGENDDDATSLRSAVTATTATAASAAPLSFGECIRRHSKSRDTRPPGECSVSHKQVTTMTTTIGLLITFALAALKVNKLGLNCLNISKLNHITSM
jgi:hypothetical protein